MFEDLLVFCFSLTCGDFFHFYSGFPYYPYTFSILCHCTSGICHIRLLKSPLNLPHLLLIRLHARFSSPSARKFLRTLIHYSGRLPINQEVKILKTCELLIKYRCFLCIYEMPSKLSAVYLFPIQLPRHSYSKNCFLKSPYLHLCV